MASLPIFFRGSEQQLVNYNFTDIISGTGYITLYAGDTSGSVSLSNITFYSDTPHSAQLCTGADHYTKDGDIDFDILCNKPIVLKGKAIVNVTFVWNTGLGDNAYVITRVRKWDGSAETEISVSTQSDTISSSNAGPVGGITGTSSTIPLTNFKKGEYIRITVEVWCSRPGGGGSSGGYIFYDPMGRTNYNGIPLTMPTNVPTTQMKVLLPVRIDL